MFISSCCLAQTGPGGVGKKNDAAGNPLQIWFKADEGTSTTVDGVKLTSWADQSGYGRNATAVVDGPTFESNEMNGQPVIRFGTSGADAMAYDGSFYVNSQFTVFALDARRDNTNNFFIGGGVGVCNQNLLIGHENNTLYRFAYYCNDLDATVSGFSGTSNPKLICATQDASSKQTFIDGTLAATDGNTTLLSAYPGSEIGRFPAIPSLFYHGDLPEYFAYNVALNEAQINLVGNYLQAKYNHSPFTGDVYTSHDPTYILDVAGVGTEASGSHAAGQSGNLLISQNSGFDNGDYVMAGHASTSNSLITNDIDANIFIASRYERIHYIDVTDSSTPITVDLDYEITGVNSEKVYVLLRRNGTTGSWTNVGMTPIVNVGVGLSFPNVSLSDGYYTIGVFPVVPTLSEWGLIILAILLMTFGTLQLINRESKETT